MWHFDYKVTFIIDFWKAFLCLLITYNIRYSFIGIYEYTRSNFSAIKSQLSIEKKILFSNLLVFFYRTTINQKFNCLLFVYNVKSTKQFFLINLLTYVVK